MVAEKARLAAEHAAVVARQLAEAEEAQARGRLPNNGNAPFAAHVTRAHTSGRGRGVGRAWEGGRRSSVQPAARAPLVQVTPRPSAEQVDEQGRALTETPPQIADAASPEAVSSVARTWESSSRASRRSCSKALVSFQSAVSSASLVGSWCPLLMAGGVGLLQCAGCGAGSDEVGLPRGVGQAQPGRGEAHRNQGRRPGADTWGRPSSPGGPGSAGLDARPGAASNTQTIHYDHRRPSSDHPWGAGRVGCLARAPGRS